MMLAGWALKFDHLVVPFAPRNPTWFFGLNVMHPQKIYKQTFFQRRKARGPLDVGTELLLGCM